MVNFKLNNLDLAAEAGDTIFEAAKKSGISIPVLCHKDNVEHYSSCMVCMVKDKSSEKFIPSCSAIVSEGMDIDASGDDVTAIRKKAIEFLLSEHRAECEAPCRVVCPAGYNIPLMNRYLASGKTGKAAELTISEINSGEILCSDCKGFCENACRRRKIDLAISIRNIKLYISETVYKNKNSDEYSPLISAKINVHRNNLKESGKADRFTSHIGRIEPEELEEWLKECTTSDGRSREIPDFESAVRESKSCMHCDCRAADDCRLRDIASEFAIKDPRGKLVNSPITKKINNETGLVFENAKCIKCGLCVRICEDKTEEPALCFINRGFVSIISEPLTDKFSDVLKKKASECINVCPTGALSYYK
jgi:ferredoxin